MRWGGGGWGRGGLPYEQVRSRQGMVVVSGFGLTCWGVHDKTSLFIADKVPFRVHLKKIMVKRHSYFRF